VYRNESKDEGIQEKSLFLGHLWALRKLPLGETISMAKLTVVDLSLWILSFSRVKSFDLDALWGQPHDFHWLLVILSKLGNKVCAHTL
jgi:hypothetical protein